MYLVDIIVSLHGLWLSLIPSRPPRIINARMHFTFSRPEGEGDATKRKGWSYRERGNGLNQRVTRQKTILFLSPSPSNLVVVVVTPLCAARVLWETAADPSQRERSLDRAISGIKRGERQTTLHK